MKAKLYYSQNNNNQTPMRKHKLRIDKNKIITREENKESNRPARAVSFGGSVNLARSAQKAFHNTIDFVNENEAAYNAIYAWIVAGLIKPIFVLHMPGSEEKDKQIVATKNFLQAFLGGFLSLTISGGFVKKAVDVVSTNLKLIKKVKPDNTLEIFKPTDKETLEIAKDVLKKNGNNLNFKYNYAKKATENIQGFEKINAFYKAFTKAKYKPSIDEITEKAQQLVKNFNTNHLKAFEKNPEFISQMLNKVGSKKTTYAEGFDIFWKNSTGLPVTIAKAMIASALLPGVMKFLFGKKNSEKEKCERAKQNILLNNSSFKNEKEQYQRMMNKNSSNNISFRGNLLTSAIDGTASLIEHAGMSKVGASLAKGLSHLPKPSARMGDFESFGITAYWVGNTIKNKKIEPSQRLGLNVHSILVTLVSSTFAMILDFALDGLIDSSQKKYSEKLNSIIDTLKQKYNTSLNNLTGIDSIETPNEAIKLAIKDKITPIADKAYDSGKEIDFNEIKKAVEELNATKTFTQSDFKIDEKLINEVISKLKGTLPVSNDIEDATKHMLGSKDIVKNLSRIDFNDDTAIKNTVKSLTKKYGKKLSKFKSLTIFTFVVRFFVPILMVPFSGKVKKKVEAWYKEKENKPLKA